MSTNLSQETSCPSCGKRSTTRLWPAIDGIERPDQRERILEESLFCWECPDCGYQMQLLYPCLYQDRERNFLLLLEPDQKEPLDKKTIAAQSPEGSKKRIVTSIEEMKEKLLIFESGLNDAACELVKLAMEQSIAHRMGVDVTAGYFSKADQEKNEITFVFVFDDEEREPLYQTTRFDAYTKTEEIADSLHFNPCGNDFLRVDPEMARLMLEEYQSR